MIIDDNENEDKKNEQKNFVYIIILKFHAKFLQNGILASQSIPW